MARAAHESGPSASPVPVAVVGATGYSGLELVQLLAAHGGAVIAGVFGSDRRGADEPRLSSVFPRLRGVCDLPVKAASVDDIVASGAKAVFLATPHAASYELAPALAERGVVVLDLSAAFRLKDASLYAAHYGFAHERGAWLARAAYGLPELFRQQVRDAMLIAVPGCYPTSVILPMSALVKAGALSGAGPIIADCISGVSGAGRHAALHTSFCEVSVQPYGVMTHRHGPEIEAYTGAWVMFTPHLGCYERGILSTIHAELAPGWTRQRVGECLQQAYGHEPFVRLLDQGQWPSVAGVRGTNFCDVGWAVDEARRRLIVVSAIDNLVKGAAGQAVQCFNVRFGLAETTGLLHAVADGKAS